MSIQRINFTSSLLDKNNVTSVKEDVKVTNPQNIEEKPDEFVSSSEETDISEKPNHKARNWAIGIGSVFVLAGLALAGRFGKLGKGIQKFLGGTVKEAEHKAGGQAKPHISTAEEESVIIDRAGAKDNVVVDEEPLIINKPKKPETTSTPKSEETPTPKTEEKPAAKSEEPKPVAEAPKLTPKQVELNAKLDRVPPKIDPELLRRDFPTLESIYKQLGIDLKELEKIDVSKYEDWTKTSLRYKMELPNNRSITILRNKNNIDEISGIDVYVNNKEVGSVTIYTDKSQTFYGDIRTRVDNVTCDYKKNGVKHVISFKHPNGNTYDYDAKGNLKAINEPNNETTGVYRTIYVKNGKIDRISHCNKEYTYLKSDYYDENGKIIDEAFSTKLEW